MSAATGWQRRLVHPAPAVRRRKCRARGRPSSKTVFSRSEGPRSRGRGAKRLPWLLVSKQGFKRPLRHDHVERYVEGNEHDHRKYEAGEQRLPESYAAHHPHEARDQQEARHVEPEPLREQAEKECRDENLHDPAQLIARDESFASLRRIENHAAETIEAGASENDRKVERKISRLRTIRRPHHAGAPVVEGKQQCQRRKD